MNFTLLLWNALTGHFIKVFPEEVISDTGIDAEIKEEPTKLRIKILQS